MNYLTLEKKKSKNTYFQLCIVIFEEEQKNFSTPPPTPLIQD